MTMTNLDLIGESRWGQMTKRRLYSDGSGRMCVMMRKLGTLRRSAVPYKEFASDYLNYSYIMERRA